MPVRTFEHQLALAWLAGFLDGEGCVRIARRAPPKTAIRANPIYSVELTVGQNCERTLDAARALIEDELGIECGKYTLVGRVKPGKAPTRGLTLRSDKAVRLLRAVRPYLRRKGEEADEAIGLGEHIKAVHASRLTSGLGLKVPLSEQEIQHREACYQRLSALKPRGPGCVSEEEQP